MLRQRCRQDVGGEAGEGTAVGKVDRQGRGVVHGEFNLTPAPWIEAGARRGKPNPQAAASVRWTPGELQA